MKRVVIESPFAGDTERNLRYLRRAMRWALESGAAPFASHGLYTQPGVLDDNDPEQRTLGIRAGQEWLRLADEVWFFVDYGITPGMGLALDLASEIGIPTRLFRIGPEPESNPACQAAGPRGKVEP